MKIEKGHYVPKELITSEAIHEAVVKCFVAAGFKDERPSFGAQGCSASSHAGLGVFKDGGICWLTSNNAGEPLTIQQLFTADNGLQWPDWAESVQCGDDGVFFTSANKGVIQFIAGSFYQAESIVLATRQPKEKEVKNEALDKAVIDLNGILPEFMPGDESILIRSTEHNSAWGDGRYSVCYRKNIDGMRVPAPWDVICDTSAFQQRAKELGHINGYRWGVEYPTNGKRPDLADDVLVEFKCASGSEPERFLGELEVSDVAWNKKQNPVPATSFRVTDHRYEPADTSYLNALTQPQSLAHSEEGLTHSEWWDYEIDQPVSRPPIGVEVLLPPKFDEKSKAVVVGHFNVDTVLYSNRADSYFGVPLDGDKMRPLDHATRKAELEKKRVVDAAFYVFAANRDGLGALYDAGYLRLPEQAK